MDGPPNPYAPPEADRRGPSTDGPGRKRVFSPRQGMVGTLLGGPLAGIYFVRANYAAKGEHTEAWTVTMAGLLLTVVIIAIAPRLPQRLPGVALPGAYAIAVQLIIEKLQFTKEQIDTSEHLARHSNWTVAGVSFLGLLAFAVFYLGVVLVFPFYVLPRRW